MAYDLQEQEQLDELKAWWGKYGNLILTVSDRRVAGICGVQRLALVSAQSS